MRVQWVNRTTEGSTFDLGWAATNREMWKWAQVYGIEHDVKAPIAFHVSSPRVFRPIRGKKNILYSLWESPDFPEEHRPYVWNADLLITGSRFCETIFKGTTPGRTEVVPLGIDPT